MTDQMPGGLERVLADIQQRLARLERDARTIAATPVAKASAPFFIPDGSPGTPSGGFVAYGSSGEPRFKTSSGDVIALPAGDVSDHTMTSSSVSNPPTQSQVNAIRTDVSNLSQQFNNALASLRADNVIG
ncbi:hypothetical protein GCM10009555_017290 [Acrocarpospora macrocephala]|uniref:Uncharacterized protein n=1 Tax=Acrocarpospora macrocephala TaxID=150177 RepID=A0A5M3WGH3_9ACTN|nr:hypothetical protein [Acrocarpospora macrocephala]GES07389.1 hypothetical protein Amac_009840 [Acrocarpospora macrocephala]